MTAPLSHRRDSSNHMGVRLRARREALELSIADMSASTHIRDDYLIALERMDQTHLPSIGYALGFVRTYATALGLDAAQVVAEYKIDAAAPQNLRLRDTPHIVVQDKIRLPRGFFAAVSVISLATMLGVWYGVQTEAQASVSAQVSSVVLPIAERQRVSAPALSDDLLTLRATAPSWVQIKDGAGTSVVSRIFVTGESWQGPVHGDYTVSVRDAGAVELFIGAESHGPLGAKGDALRDIPLTQPPS